MSAFGSRDYKDLFLVYEAILSYFDKDKMKAAKKIVAMRWASDAELESFRETAHNYFRHHTPKPQSVPFMEPAIADNLMRRLFSYFVVHCMRAKGLV